MGAPVIGAICSAGHEAGEGGVGATITTTQSTAARWNFTMAYRYQNSFRHFRGDVEQLERLDDETQVENNLNVFDFGLSYQITPRWSMSVSAPFTHVTRMSHRNDTETRSVGIGDMSIGAKFWLFRPPSESQQNVQLGFGIKLPTGDSNVTNRVSPNIINVDQSIQLGDSGTGVSLDVMGYKSIRRFTLFSSATYLLNPKNTHAPEGWVRNGNPPAGIGYQGFSQPGTVFSVSDQYLLQVGSGYAVPKLVGFAFTGTARMEGVPARDLIGREDGFRRPGYGVSVAPGLMYSRSQNTWSVSTPIAVKRDRTRSVPDIRNNSHGDAAFADWLLLLSYSRSF
jgi:hypothetical protein